MQDVQQTLLVSIALVILVVAIFVRRLSAVVATGGAVPLSLLGTLAVMWLAGFSLNNLTLMALTISVGFVVDDAIVMIEAIAVLRDRGMRPLQAALAGARQIGFTVVSITVSLIAVFIPLVFMDGVLGRMFREFSVTLAIAVALSGVVSLTVTPMLAAHMARRAPPPPGWLGQAIERAMAALTRAYVRSLRRVLRWRRSMLLGSLGLIGITVWLYVIAPKGFFPDQDTGLVMGNTKGAAGYLLPRHAAAPGEHRRRSAGGTPRFAHVVSVIGVGNGNGAVSSGRLTVSLKPRRRTRQRLGGRGGAAAARAARRGPRHRGQHLGGAGDLGRRPAGCLLLPIRPALYRTSPRCRPGRKSWCGSCAPCPASRTFPRTSRIRAWSPGSASTGRRRRGSAFPCRRSPRR